MLTPLFPLGLVVFPTEPVPLHIFEPRYRQMIADCEAEEKPFGIAYSDGESIATIGTALVIDRVLNREEDGRVNLVAKGTKRFTMENRIPGTDTPGGKLYDQAEVSWFEDDSEEWDENLATGIFTLHKLLMQLVRGGDEPQATTYGGLSRLSFTTGCASGLDSATKQSMLELQNENDRLRKLAEHLAQFIPQLKALNELQNEIDQKWSLLEEL